MRAPRADPSVDAALLHALERVLAPAARLAVSSGLPFDTVEQLLKRAFVDAARAAQRSDAAATVSGLATATGLSRREVTRLLQDARTAPPERPSLATQVFTRWRADRGLRDRRGHSRPLPRLGAAPSFEALAQSVTRDVHPRTLLEELCRLGLAQVDADGERVHLVQDAFVPRDDSARMLGFLGANAGDHFAATVANVLGDERQHFDQAVFADDLSDTSVAVAKRLLQAQWRSLMAALVPEIEALVRADAAATAGAAPARRRLRVGLYSYDEAMPARPGHKGRKR